VEPRPIFPHVGSRQDQSPLKPSGARPCRPNDSDPPVYFEVQKVHTREMNAGRSEFNGLNLLSIQQLGALRRSGNFTPLASGSQKEVTSLEAPLLSFAQFAVALTYLVVL